MIYFDNSATTYPKPDGVIRTMQVALTKYGGNPGRSGHKISEASGMEVFKVREKLSQMYNVPVENCAFTMNCTYALNLAVKGVMGQNGGHIITSDLEHNSVIRPIHSLYKRGICTYSIANVYEDDEQTLESFRKKITPKTRAIAVTLASNVTGQILPYRKLAKLCAENNICFIADGAQACGVIGIDMKKDGINILCTAGHKGLYGPMGTGVLMTDGKYPLSTLIEGGTGSVSSEIESPEFYPDRLEAGTPNTPGIIGLGAGVDFVSRIGTENIFNHENKLKNRFIAGIEGIDGIKLYTAKNSVPIVSFNLFDIDSANLATVLSDIGFALRGGLHCSFLAHTKLGTIESGTVRFSPSISSTVRETDRLIYAVGQISQKYKTKRMNA